MLICKVFDINKTYKWLQRAGLEVRTQLQVMATKEQALNTKVRGWGLPYQTESKVQAVQ